MWITTAAYQPFEAEMMVSKKAMNLGFFSTAEETALSCARRRAAEPAAAQCRRVSLAAVRLQCAHIETAGASRPNNPN